MSHKLSNFSAHIKNKGHFPTMTQKIRAPQRIYELNSFTVNQQSLQRILLLSFIIYIEGTSEDQMPFYTHTHIHNRKEREKEWYTILTSYGVLKVSNFPYNNEKCLPNIPKGAKEVRKPRFRDNSRSMMSWTIRKRGNSETIAFDLVSKLVRIFPRNL